MTILQNTATILLIDDDETTNFYNELLIRQHFADLKVVIATNGQKALEYIKEHGMPHIILLDINMPVMDGFEFLETFQMESISPRPIVAMLTTSLNPTDMERATQFPQINQFLTKPLAIKELKKLLS